MHPPSGESRVVLCIRAQPNQPTYGSYSHGFMLMTARQNVSRSANVLAMGEKATETPSSPGVLVGPFPDFRKRDEDALIVYVPE